MPPKRAAYVIWVNGVTNPDQLAIARRLAAFLGNGATAVDLSVSTATSIPPDKRSQDRARNDALLEFVFAADRKYKAVVITDLQYNTAQGRHAFEEVQTAARVADRPFLPVYLNSAATATATTTATGKTGQNTADSMEDKGPPQIKRALAGGHDGRSKADSSGARRDFGDAARGAAAGGPTNRVADAEMVFRGPGTEGLSVDAWGRSGAAAALEIYRHVCDLEQGVKWVDLEEDSDDGGWSLVSKGREPSR